MKYFTRDWYQEMQVCGFLTFPDSKEDWEQNVNNFKSLGIDYTKRCKEALNSQRNNLLRFLPDFFHPYILDGTLNSEYPSTELRDKAVQWINDYNNRMDTISHNYFRHYNLIKDQLPLNVVHLVENSLHDAKVKSFRSISHETFAMILDCRGGFHYFSDVKLTFTGVQKLQIPERFEGARWLYDEVYFTKPGFELNILFGSPLLEMKIIAENVWIDKLNT